MRFRSLFTGAVLAALLAAGCGRDNPELIPQQDADDLLALVQEAGQASADGECDAAREAVAEARRDYEASASWQVTRPLRALAQAARSLRRSRSAV